MFTHTHPYAYIYIGTLGKGVECPGVECPGDRGSILGRVIPKTFFKNGT